jgi:hypothetical protein
MVLLRRSDLNPETRPGMHPDWAPEAGAAAGSRLGAVNLPAPSKDPTYLVSSSIYFLPPAPE